MKTALFCLFISFGFCACADENKCGLTDSECQRNFFQNIGTTKAYTGIPEIGVPVIDPFKLTNVKLSILGLLDLTLVEGEAEGIGKCIVTKFVTSIEEMYRGPEVTCGKIIIRGHYKLTPAPIVGEECDWCRVRGDGQGKITLENWTFKIKYPFKFLKQKDGEIYLKALFEDAEYKATVENVILEATGIKLGHLDISKSVTRFINHNWKLIMASDIGKFINDKSAQYYYDIYRIFFDSVPANQYITDDLTKFVSKKTSKNNSEL